MPMERSVIVQRECDDSKSVKQAMLCKGGTKHVFTYRKAQRTLGTVQKQGGRQRGQRLKKG
eukprot:757586-Hanusia_phi.AAC.3